MAKDVYHELVKKALENEGWIITHDPMSISNKNENIDYEIDLGAEKLIAAEKDAEKIAVEVKSFLKVSLTNEFHGIFGQYLIYEEILEVFEPDRILFLAMPDYAFERLKKYPFLQHLLNKHNFKFLVFNSNEAKILSWKK